MDLGETKIVISSVDVIATFTVGAIGQCVSPQPVGQHRLHEQRRKRETRCKKIDNRPRPKRQCEVTVPLRERVQRLSSSWGEGPATQK